MGQRNKYNSLQIQVLSQINSQIQISLQKDIIHSHGQLLISDLCLLSGTIIVQLIIKT